MSIDPNLFKQVMAQWSSGITIVTSTLDGNWQGITVNSFASVSLTPPLVSVNIDRKLYIHSVISQSGVFAASILSADQVEWGKVFAGFFPEIQNRFEGISCQIAATGSPILPDVVGWVDCQVRYAFDVGDHTIFVGEAVAGDTPLSAPALAYHNRSWGEFVTQLPDKVQLVEAGPVVIPAEAKAGIIESLLDAGLTRIQVGALGDPTPAESYHRLPKREGVIYSAVILGADGLKHAFNAGLTHINLLVPIHEEFSREILNLPPSAVMEQFVGMVSQARERGMRISSRILCAFGYREAADVDVQTVADLVRSCVDNGVQEIVLDDTSGVANPLTMRKTLTAVLAAAGNTPIGVRLSNRHGFGLANMVAALQTGVTQFETGIGGLGGQVFSTREASILPTEDAANLLHSMGIQTGVSVGKIADVSRRAESILGKRLSGNVYTRSISTEKVAE